VHSEMEGDWPVEPEGPNVTIFLDSGLTRDARYFYRVPAKYCAGLSWPREPHSAVVSPVRPPTRSR
jgi:hypothetical protein